MLYIFLTSPEWAMALMILLVFIMIFLFVFRFKDEEPSAPMKSMPLCNYLMDGRRLKGGDVVIMDGSMVVLTELEALWLTEGSVKCDGITVANLTK